MKNPYKNIPTTIWLIAAITLISRCGSMVLIFLPIYLTHQLKFGLILAGQTLASYGVGEVTGSYLGGVLSDRYGFLRIQALGLLIMGVLFLALEFFSNQIQVIVTIFLVGCCAAGIRSATGSNIAANCSSNNRARSYALNYQALNLGSAIGPMLGGLLANINYAWLFRIDGFANILASVALTIFFYKTLVRRPSIFGNNKSNTTSSWLNFEFLALLLLILLIGVCFFLSFNVYPVFLKSNYYISESMIGVVLGVNGLLIILFQMQITEYVKRFDSLRVVGVGGIVMSLGYFILPFYSGTYYAILSVILITIGEMVAVPFLFDFVIGIAPLEARGRCLGLVTCMLMSVPLAITPSIGMFFYEKFGTTLFWEGVGLMGIIIFFLSELINKKINYVRN